MHTVLPIVKTKNLFWDPLFLKIKFLFRGTFVKYGFLYLILKKAQIYSVKIDWLDIIMRSFLKIIKNPWFLLRRSYNEEKDKKMEATRKRRFLQKVEGFPSSRDFSKRFIRNLCFLLWRSFDEEKDKRMEATR
jgi:hypothetical protein